MPVEPMGVFAQHDVELAAALRGEHLAPETFADGGDLVGEKDPALEQIQPAEILDAGRFEISLRQIRQIEIESPKTSLLRQMMDREHGRKRQFLFGHQHRDKRRSPIVHVKNLRRWRHPPRHLQRGFGEENETRRVVFVGDAVFAIDARAIEKLVAANKKHLHAAGRPTFDKFRDISLRADADIDRDAGIAQIESP